MSQSWKPLLESYCTPTVLLQVLSALPTSNMTCFYLNLFAGSCPPFVAGHNKQSINSSDGAEPRENWIDGLKTVSASQKHIYFDSIDGKDSKLMLCAVGRPSSARGFDDCTHPSSVQFRFLFLKDLFSYPPVPRSPVPPSLISPDESTEGLKEAGISRAHADAPLVEDRFVGPAKGRDSEWKKKELQGKTGRKRKWRGADKQEGRKRGAEKAREPHIIKNILPPPDGTSARRNSSARSGSSPQSAARKESETPLKAPQEPWSERNEAKTYTRGKDALYLSQTSKHGILTLCAYTVA
ncbi:hypothetical protein B0H14DRAFT_2648792 [Mycena olivaceomarginata]|nr:hypothetical protein B0H14DRAFT_2648792 [Mycena olivaceomarginata]